MSGILDDTSRMMPPGPPAEPEPEPVESTDPRPAAPASLRVTWVMSSQTTPTPQEDPAPTSAPASLTAQIVP